MINLEFHHSSTLKPCSCWSSNWERSRYYTLRLNVLQINKIMFLYFTFSCILVLLLAGIFHKIKWTVHLIWYVRHIVLVSSSMGNPWVMFSLTKALKHQLCYLFTMEIWPILCTCLITNFGGTLVIVVLHLTLDFGLWCAIRLTKRCQEKP